MNGGLSWSERWEAGICTQVDPDLWTPERGQPTAPGKRICRTCPLVDACLEWALEHQLISYDSGIWGGTDPRQRRRMLADKEAAA